MLLLVTLIAEVADNLRELKIDVADRARFLLAVGETVLIVLFVAFEGADITLRNISFRSSQHQLGAARRTYNELVRSSDSELISTRRATAMWVHGSVQGAVVRAQAAVAQTFANLPQLVARLSPTSGEGTRRELTELQDKLDETLLDLSASVREKAKELWPEHQELPLRPALEKVCGAGAELQVSPDLDWSDVDTSAGLRDLATIAQLRTTKRRLGVQSRYDIVRIVEEAIINARKHGSTKEHVTVTLADETIEITVVNNGSPLSTSYQAGLGQAVMNEIVARRSGTWSLRDSPEGVTFTASFSVEVTTLEQLARALMSNKA